MKYLYSLYRNKGWLFALICILIYCIVLAPVRGELGDDSPWMTAALAVYSALLLFFVKANGLEGEIGLDRWPSNWKKYLYFIPVWIISTGNLWAGFGNEYGWPKCIFAALSMILVGFVEEMIFRGFLFRALIPDGLTKAVIISSLTFGIGHIVNLFSGQATLKTILQVVFAVAWGFIFTFIYLKGGSLLPCILSHSLVDLCSVFARDSELVDYIYICATIAVSAAYCFFLSKKANRLITLVKTEE